MEKDLVKGHLFMFLACAIWGLMAPLGKDAMLHGISGMEMVTFRVAGASVCFWLASLFTKHEHVERRDFLRLFGAGLFAIVLNQCNYTVGLSLTSPVNASIVTTTLPFTTMFLAYLALGEPITGKKALGVLIGAAGAILLITASVASTDGRAGSLRGDLQCLLAQCSFAIYLTFFKQLIGKYSVITLMKWMATFSTAVILPFTFTRVAALPWTEITMTTYLETAFVVVGGTFFAYIFSIQAQKILRPTIIAMYNYVQPIVACGVSVFAGLAIFGWRQALAVVLVFTGVYLVNKAPSPPEGHLPPNGEEGCAQQATQPLPLKKK